MRSWGGGQHIFLNDTPQRIHKGQLSHWLCVTMEAKSRPGQSPAAGKARHGQPAERQTSLAAAGWLTRTPSFCLECPSEAGPPRPVSTPNQKPQKTAHHGGANAVVTHVHDAGAEGHRARGQHPPRTRARSGRGGQNGGLLHRGGHRSGPRGTPAGIRAFRLTCRRRTLF